MSRSQKALQHGPLDGHKVWADDKSSKICFSSGDVYLRNDDGEFVYSEWQSKAMKIEINEMLAGRKTKRSGRR